VAYSVYSDLFTHVVNFTCGGFSDYFCIIFYSGGWVCVVSSYEFLIEVEASVINEYCSNFAFVWSLNFEKDWFSTIEIFVSLNTLGLQYLFVVTVLVMMDIGCS